MGNGDIFQGDVELLSSLQQVGADSVADGFTLCDQLSGVKLGDDGFEDFVSDGREDTLIVILAKILIFSLASRHYIPEH
jgi:hypothetical protein